MCFASPRRAFAPRELLGEAQVAEFDEAIRRDEYVLGLDVAAGAGAIQKGTRVLISAMGFANVRACTRYPPEPLANPLAR